MEHALEEQNKIFFDEEITLNLKEEFKKAKEFEDFLSSRRLVAVSFVEYEVLAVMIYELMERYGDKLSKLDLSRIYANAKAWIDKITEDKGERNVSRYFKRVSLLMNFNDQIKRFVEGLEGDNLKIHSMIMKLKEVKPNYLETVKDKTILLLIHKISIGKYPRGSNDLFSETCIDYCLSVSQLSKFKVGNTVRTHDLVNDKGMKD